MELEGKNGFALGIPDAEHLKQGILDGSPADFKIEPCEGRKLRTQSIVPVDGPGFAPYQISIGIFFNTEHVFKPDSQWPLNECLVGTGGMADVVLWNCHSKLSKFYYHSP